jgi:hypothetical protein
MKKFLGIAVVFSVLSFGSGPVVSAKVQTVMFPDVDGNMVRIPVAHTYAQCRKNGRHLRYSDEQSHDWCKEHCNGSICQ